MGQDSTENERTRTTEAGSDQVRREDIEEIGALAASALSTVTGAVGEMHQAISNRPFEILGPMAAPVRTAHDAIAQAVYESVHAGVRAASKAGAAAMAQRAVESSPPLGNTPAGGHALAALGGLFGDTLHAQQSRFALPMEVRRDRTAVQLTRASVRAAFPEGGGRIAIFLHGLCESDESWWYRSTTGDPELQPSYGERLQRELAITPVYLRYNSGLHVSHNGREASIMIEALVDAWATPVREIVLVGHSMGGLVARSACHYGQLEQRRWVAAAKHVFCLGTPHLGADLKRARTRSAGRSAAHPRRERCKRC